MGLTRLLREGAMRRNVLLCLAVMLVLSVQATQAGDSPLVRLSFEPSMQAGAATPTGT